ncbi:hypothetical protein BIZ83_gp261 [Erwinia phage vB_EamM_ChrisDB]|jgi:hypothetical protein|uniref:hypothetical protein n=1 Tax=Erwinia phage vB_EamM_ChrisDB TaxID=1883371 RepID=UPI00081CE888|nr:hypothetical protein BIZ83_gp261 [Erwinia phage vB_EamM_ChrisDB]ANZ48592.1 hypothetical protein CHRISDB_30 [Erwinia phage vB_EamM_ChrisDB]
MKVYFELRDICDIDGILGRVNIESAYYNPKRTPHLCYMFVAEYAREALEQIVNHGLGVGFVTFTPPDQYRILARMKQLWSEEDILALRISFDSIALHEEVRFFELQQIVQAACVHSGFNRMEIAEQTKVTLFMNEIGNALICMEC